MHRECHVTYLVLIETLSIVLAFFLCYRDNISMYETIICIFCLTETRNILNKSYWIGINKDEPFSLSNLGLERQIDQGTSDSCVAFTSYFHIFAFQLTTVNCNLQNFFICKLSERCMQIKA
jgi:hypothetical protein